MHMKEKCSKAIDHETLFNKTVITSKNPQNNTSDMSMKDEDWHIIDGFTQYLDIKAKKSWELSVYCDF